MAMSEKKYRIINYFGPDGASYKRYYTGSGWTRNPNQAGAFHKSKVNSIMADMDNDGLYPLREEVGYERIGKYCE